MILAEIVGKKKPGRMDRVSRRRNRAAYTEFAAFADIDRFGCADALLTARIDDLPGIALTARNTAAVKILQQFDGQISTDTGGVPILSNGDVACVIS